MSDIVRYVFDEFGRQTRVLTYNDEMFLREKDVLEYSDIKTVKTRTGERVKTVSNEIFVELEKLRTLEKYEEQPCENVDKAISNLNILITMESILPYHPLREQQINQWKEEKKALEKLFREKDCEIKKI